EVDVFPQEITRALLNLISNGFYAATKRKKQDSSDGYEPILAASTKNLGDRVAITIRDNGPGISPEVVQSLLHDKTRWGRHGPWPVHHSRHHRQATFGVYRGRYAAR